MGRSGRRIVEVRQLDPEILDTYDPGVFLRSAVECVRDQVRQQTSGDVKVVIEVRAEAKAKEEPPC